MEFPIQSCFVVFGLSALFGDRSGRGRRKPDASRGRELLMGLSDVLEVVKEYGSDAWQVQELDWSGCPGERPY